MIPTPALTQDEPQEDDDPRLSSAALCISLNLLGYEFRPEYTHQCFEGERIIGFQPSEDALSEAKTTSTDSTSQKLLIHSSHQYHIDATHHLDLSVVIAPSCKTCSISFNASEKSNKKARLGTNQEDVNKNENSNNNIKSVSSDVDREDEKMSKDEILRRVGKTLPTIVQAEESVQNNYLDKPIGRILKKYSRKIHIQKGNSQDEAQFFLCLADGTEASDYHEQVQKLALCFIENADCIDLTSNEGGGYWKALYLFRKHAETKYSLAGYMTLFHFLSPFKKPKSGVVVRICQALVLPLYQRSGHGKVMFEAIHEVANESHTTIMSSSANNDGMDKSSTMGEIVEINVEDPAPGFVALRDRVDYELLARAVKSGKPWNLEKKYIASSIERASDESCFVPLSDADAVAAGAVAKITCKQVRIAYELYKLDVLQQGQDKNDSLSKRYRIMVKKRLMRTHREDLGGLATKHEKQEFLSNAFEETFSHYRSIITSQKQA